MKFLKRVFFQVYEIKSLVRGRQWLILLFFAFAQMLSAILDLIAIALLGALSSLATSEISSIPIGDRAKSLLSNLGLETLDLRNKFLILGGLVLASLLFKSLVSIVLFKSNLKYLAKLSSEISRNLINSFFSKSVSFINKKSSQHYIFSLTSGVNVLVISVIGPSTAAIGDLFLILVLVLAMFIAEPTLTAITCSIFLLVAILTTFGIQKRAQLFGKKLSDIQVKSGEIITNGLLLFKILVVRNAQKLLAEEVGKLRKEYADTGAKARFLHSISKFAFEIASVLTIFSIGIYSFLAFDAVRAVTLVVLFVVASGRILPALMRLQQSIIGLRSSISEAEKTMSLVRELRSIESSNKHIDLMPETSERPFNPRLVLKNVCFKFEPEKEIIKNFSLKIEPGELVALVGTSGIGKSTLVDLMLGLLDPDLGSIEISDTSPENVFEIYPGKVSYVPQDSYIFKGSLRENLTVGLNSNRFGDDELWGALRDTLLEDHFRKSTDGLDTEIGERGSSLSGGQRQRIGIARALMSSPEFLVLDEATNAIDINSEAKILGNIFGRESNRTGVIITHRAETLKYVNRVIILEGPGLSREEGVSSFSISSPIVFE